MANGIRYLFLSRALVQSLSQNVTQAGSRMLLMLLLACSALPVQAHNAVGGVYAIGDKIEGKVGFGNGTPAAEGTPVEVQNAEGKVLGQLTVQQGGAFFFTAKVLQDHYFLVDMGGGHIVKLRLPADELSLGHADDAEPKAHSHVPHSHGTLTHTHDGGTHSHAVTQTAQKTQAEAQRDERAEILAAMGDHADDEHGEAHTDHPDDGTSDNTGTAAHSHEAGHSTGQATALQNLIEIAVARQVKPLRQELAEYKEQAKFRDLLGGLGYLLGLAGIAAWLSQRRKNRAA